MTGLGVMDILKQRLTPAILSPRTTIVGPSWDDWATEITSDVHSASPAKLFRTQPHLHTVVSFLARNVAQLGLHVFVRLDETDRQRDRTSPLARLLAAPGGDTTVYELIYALIGDLCLYDRAYWVVTESADSVSGFDMRRIPPGWVSVKDSTPFAVKTWTVSLGDGNTADVPASQMLAFTGYSPVSPVVGSPALEALRGTLQEQIEAASYRRQVWKRGGRVSAVLQRPKEAPAWSDAARERFREDWYAKYTGRGPGAGGTPILEDGMTLQRIDFNAQEQQFVEAAKLSLQTVAAGYHVNPTMIGQNEGATYSNVREFRRMLYGDTLGPLLAQIESRINTFLIPMLGMDQDSYYVEFNIAEKLQGSFEEQTTALVSATGAPYMTRNETRARMNLPALPEGDGLVVPLNVLIGGQASPRDSGSQNQSPKSRRVKSMDGRRLKAAAMDEKFVEKHTEVLRAFFKRQERSVLSALGSKDNEDWWDDERWDGELSDDLYALSVSTATKVGRRTLEDAGMDPDDYDEDRTLAFLRTVADGDAANINASTKQQVEEAAKADGMSVVDVFSYAHDTRALENARTLVTGTTGFATTEAARQQSPAATKTWVVTSGNPRASHAAMDGETVPLDEPFSNGLDWPGAYGDPSETAGCECTVEINIP